MANARLHDMGPDALNLPKAAPGKTWLVFEAEGSAEELDGAIRVVGPMIQALGPLNVSVELAEKLGRVAGAVGAAMSPNSPGGRSVTLGEGAGVFVVAVS